MRINLFAGPGAGKTTICSYLFAELKKLDFNVEQIKECIKEWAYLGRVPKSFEPVKIFGDQMYAEDLPLSRGVDHVITDSPLLMQIPYMQRYNFPDWESLLELCRSFERKYPSINIFLDRHDLEYREIGRYEDYKTAKAMDERIKDFLKSETHFYVAETKNSHKILEWLPSLLIKNQVAA